MPLLSILATELLKGAAYTTGCLLATAIIEALLADA